jgi:hypothetical protein
VPGVIEKGTGGLAAIVAIIQAIYEWREKRQKNLAARHAPATMVPPSPPPGETLPAAPSTRRLTNLPAQFTHLIGREDELSEVEEVYLRRRCSND